VRRLSQSAVGGEILLPQCHLSTTLIDVHVGVSHGRETLRWMRWNCFMLQVGYTTCSDTRAGIWKVGRLISSSGIFRKAAGHPNRHLTTHSARSFPIVKSRSSLQYTYPYRYLHHAPPISRSSIRSDTGYLHTLTSFLSPSFHIRKRILASTVVPRQWLVRVCTMMSAP
jgi:hypothetical protein